jgi:hypothetical protein
MLPCTPVSYLSIINNISYFIILCSYEPTFPDGQRPRLVYLESSENIAIHHIGLQNASDWHVHALGCRNVTLDNVHIYGDWRFPNNDGVDPESCIDFSITNSDINVADDGVCPKAKKGFGPLKNLLVRNVSIRSKSHAIKFGTNCDVEMSDIVFEDILIWDSNGGLGIQQRSEGDIHNVTFRDIRLETRYVAPRWWGNGEWLTITAEPRHEGDIIGQTYNITFENIFAVSENGGLISGRQNGIRGLVMRNITIVMDAWSNYSAGEGPKCQQKDTSGVGDNEIICMGTHDHRPSFEEDANCSYYCRTPGLADGIYLENVHDAHFHHFSVTFGGSTTSAAVPYWGECFVVDLLSTNITSNDMICEK